MAGVLKSAFAQPVGMGDTPKDTIKPAVSNGIPAPSFPLPVRFFNVLRGLPSAHFDLASSQTALIS